jgi:hypothetical protein
MEQFSDVIEIEAVLRNGDWVEDPRQVTSQNLVGENPFNILCAYWASVQD